MSKYFLKLIKNRFQFFLFVFSIGMFVSLYTYVNKPVIYSAKGVFKYIEPEGINKVTKVDENGTITYESFMPGNSGLNLQSLIQKNSSLKLSLNSGNAIYTLTSESQNKDIPIKEVNNFLDSLFYINFNFLEEKLLETKVEAEIVKIKSLIQNPKKSFPLLIKADKVETIDNRYLILLTGFILSFFIALTSLVLKERVDEL
ncbi:MAG: hypothetical protein ACRDAQ_09905 [Cetobacterium sp.]